LDAIAGRHADPFRAVLLRLLKGFPEDPQAIDSLFLELAGAPEANWDALTRCATQHGVTGLLDGALAGSAAAPQAVRDRAARRDAVAGLWQAHLLDVLESAVAALGKRGISVAALKGPVLAARLYPSGTTRHCIDLDLLVHEADLDRAIETLRSDGFEPDNGPGAAYLRRHGHHIHLAKTGLPPVELHFCTYAGFGVAVPSEALLDRAEPFTLPKGAAVLVPSGEDEFIYLATHAAGHSFIRLMWLYDMKLLLRKNPALDWNQVVSRAASWGVASPVSYTTRLLRSWFGAELPQLPQGLQRHGVRTRLADWLLPEVSSPQPASPRDNFGGLLFTSLLCDRLSSGFFLMQHHVTRSLRRRLSGVRRRSDPTDR
jgi:hypothetical protein